MILKTHNLQTSLFNYFFVFCLFIYAGSATVFARELGDIRTVGNAFAMFITAAFFVLNRIKLGKPYFISIAVFLLYAAITSFNNKMINPHWISEWMIWLTIAYLLCQGLKENLFAIVETVLCVLCVISLVFWGIHLIRPDLITTLVSVFEFSRPYAEECNVEANMILYTINADYSANDFQLLLRNAGFAWEPGALACFACLGIYCNLLRTNLKLLNPSLWVFLLTLASTQSTTGFIIFIMMIALWLALNKKYAYLILLVPVVIGLYELPFVKEKLTEEIDNMKYMDYSMVEGAVGRLYSLQLNFEEFLRHPIIGLGGYTEGTWLAQHGYEVATISGIGNMLVYFGAIMTALFLFLLIKACLLIQKVFDSPNAWILIAIIIGMMVSYNLWKQPIFIAFWMYGVYGYDYVTKKTTTKIDYSIPCSI